MPVYLRDLEPLLVRYDGPLKWTPVESLAEASGVCFCCPKCYGTDDQHAVMCWFRGRVPDDLPPGPGRWDPTGDGIDNLTLHPSVHLSTTCGWHGWVSTGSAT